jgi:uncharacterized protein (TIGR02453 family)
MTPRFRPEGLRFLRSLKRNNRREWFNAHRDDYEARVRQPMLDIIASLAEDMRVFAPEIVVNPKSMYRIYRDVRFSENKAPYKTHVAASFPTRGLPKHEGAGLYFHVSPDELWVGGGMYAPQTARCMPSASTSPPTSSGCAPSWSLPNSAVNSAKPEGEQLQRVPRGFPKDHEAAQYLVRQFLAGREFAPAFATSPRFYGALVNAFKRAAPIRFLNER